MINLNGKQAFYLYVAPRKTKKKTTEHKNLKLTSHLYFKNGKKNKRKTTTKQHTTTKDSNNSKCDAMSCYKELGTSF